tara:strand:- start:65 stop:1525 length:1461 start_codon:yes stop_codon:yes gene_type:complete
MERLTIVGGGTAGWFAAFLISKTKPNIQIDLIESSDIASVGVGEGTTSKVLEILAREQYGIDSYEFIRSIDALPKMGINFVGWSDKGDYMSPIGASATSKTYIDYSVYAAPLLGKDVTDCNESGYLAKTGYTNLIRKFDGSLQYDEFYPALHLDAGKLVEYLKSKSQINHIIDTVLEVRREDGDITSLLLENYGEYFSNFYIDCTGFKRQLTDSEWIDYSHYLPIDRGMPFRLENDTAEKHSYTNAVAMNSGWVWEIPTKNRIGRGYCYSSKYSDEQTAIKELEDRYNTGVEKIKSIEFSSGRLSKIMSGNCLALGLSAAFFEPLQATSLHCSLQQLDEFIFTFLQDDCILRDQVSVDRYNKRYAKMYDDMKDFIFIHYTGGKTNTPFWKHFTEVEYPEQVSRLMHLHDVRLLRDYDVDSYHGHAGIGLWIPTLIGLGHYNPDTVRRVLECDIDWKTITVAIENFKDQLDRKIVQRNYQSIKNLIL